MSLSKTESIILGVLLIVLVGVLVWIGSIVVPYVFPSFSLNANTATISTSTPQQNASNPNPVYSCPPCSVQVNSWRFDINEIHADRGMDSSRRNIVLLGNIYNQGRVADLFLPQFLMVLKDSNGRIYESDITATSAAESKYGTEFMGGGNLNPGAHNYVAYGYDVPASEKTFTISPGELASSWGNSFTFSVP